MSDTVQKLMSLVQEYASDYAHALMVTGVGSDPRDSRQALEDELTRLFAPMADRVFESGDSAVSYLHGHVDAANRYEPVLQVALEALQGWKNALTYTDRIKACNPGDDAIKAIPEVLD